LALLAKIRTDWHLDHVGGGPASHSYEAMASGLRIADHVTFHGYCPKNEVAQWMQKSSLVVVPSVYETFSVVAAEALASGVPVLSTRCGGPEEFITNEVGMLVAPSDPKAMSDALGQMLATLAAFIPERLSEYARQRFSPELVGGVFHQIYLDACAKSTQIQ
jgi:L-malate glycosyltransferase